MKTGKIILRIGLFLVGVGLLVFGIFSVFRIASKRSYMMADGFYSERKNSLDAVFIGASNVYASWAPPFAWAQKGIAVYSYSVPEMPAKALKYVAEEVRKTQQNALMIVCLNNFKDKDLGYEVSALHYLTDFMPFSATRFRLVNELKKGLKEDTYHPLEFTFPFIRFHERWNQLTEEDFDFHNNGLKGATATSFYYKKMNVKGKTFQLSSDLGVLKPEETEVLMDLLDWFRTTKTPVLFVINPQVINKKEQSRLNTVSKIVKEQGFPLLDLHSRMKELGIDPVLDFYDSKHNNVHGALKYTRYVTNYLVENYGFTDKRGQAGYESWDAASEIYYARTSPYLLDFEFEDAPRDYELNAPEITNCSYTESGSVSLAWNPQQGADFYRIYRRLNNLETQELSAFSCIATVKKNQLSFVDSEVDNNTYRYRYTVVPVRLENGRELFGNFDQKGKRPKE